MMVHLGFATWVWQNQKTQLTWTISNPKQGFKQFSPVQILDKSFIQTFTYKSKFVEPLDPNMVQNLEPKFDSNV